MLGYPVKRAVNCQTALEGKAESCLGCFQQWITAVKMFLGVETSYFPW